MRQRIAQLEGELATAHDTIARLKGHMHERASDDMAALLQKETVHVRRELDVVLSDDGLEAIANMLRQRLPKSHVTMVGKTLHCKTQTGSIQVVRREGFTEVVIDDAHPQPWWAKVVGGFGLSVLGGPLLAAPFAALGLPKATLLAYVPLVLVSSYLIMHQLLAATFLEQRQVLAGAVEAAIALAQDHGEEAERLRFEVAPSESDDAAAEEEALAVEQSEATGDVSTPRALEASET